MASVSIFLAMLSVFTVLQYSGVICRLYENAILPESHSKPYLIYAYSDFCFHCMQVAPVWDQMQEDMEKIGTVFCCDVWW